ncbi:hypothetical protein V7006_06270 [Bacillus safensis]|uniref:YxiF family protein n=1 Tax=Bacillus safensis TaxID=561879 RepID=UPI00119D746C|nr:hypothetical protein [Bacillus safensis]MEC2426128.1 hypothetical protein [Bacillus safensis]GLF84074.1 hypothetical protein B33_27790 [Bacillus safensis]
MHIEKSVQMLKELVSWVKVASAQARFMCFREHEIEAVEVNVYEVFIHLNHLLEQTKFSSGYGDFIFGRIFPFWITHRENGIFL